MLSKNEQFSQIHTLVIFGGVWYARFVIWMRNQRKLKYLIFTKGCVMMEIKKIKAMHLALVEKEGGKTRKGEEYTGYCCWSFAVKGESNSRKFYKKDGQSPEIWRTVKNLEFGEMVEIDGDVSEKGAIDVTAVHVINDFKEVEL